MDDKVIITHLYKIFRPDEGYAKDHAHCYCHAVYSGINVGIN